MLYRYKLTPASPLITPLMSDTFFGHFCWAVSYREGETFLSDLLDSYGNPTPAPVLFSSAFPSGTLPRPSLPRPGMDKIREFVRGHFGEEKKNLFQGMSTVRKWDDRRLVSTEQWMKVKDAYSEERLYEELMAASSLTTEEQICKIEVTAANVVNRVSGIVPAERDALFHKEKNWYYEGVVIDLYVEINDESIRDLLQWFLLEFLPESGFGADKSAGMGAMAIVPDDAFDPAIFSTPDANARLSLSLASFLGIEQYDAFYRLKTKFGRLGGDFAVSGPDGDPKPFKKPVLMYEPGAVFFCSESLSHAPLLKNVHSDTRIRHCGIPITLPFKAASGKR